MKTFKTYQEEIYLDEMVKAGALTEDEVDKLAGFVLRGTGKLAKVAAKGGAKVLGWAAKKAIKTARERITTKGKMERQRRKVSKAKEREAYQKEREKLLKVKQAQRQKRKAQIKSVLDKVQRNTKPIPRPKGTGPGPITP